MYYITKCLDAYTYILRNARTHAEIGPWHANNLQRYYSPQDSITPAVKNVNNYSDSIAKPDASQTRLDAKQALSCDDSVDIIQTEKTGTPPSDNVINNACQKHTDTVAPSNDLRVNETNLDNKIIHSLDVRLCDNKARL